MGRSKQKRYGQNYLVQTRFVPKIVGALGEAPPRVLEIGPGRGALTGALLESAERLVAIELDEELLPGLQPLVERGLELIHGDALRNDLDEMLGSEGRWSVAANLPYSVATPILRRLMRRADLFDRLVVMLQDEVTERFIATTGSSSCGLVSLETQAFCSKAQRLFKVPPQAFRPRPRVSSSVAAFDLQTCAHDPELLEKAFSLASSAFTRRRQKLRNALSGRLTQEEIEAAGVDPDLRPHQLDLESWLKLARV